MQETYRIPPGWLTEGSVELGNKLVKQATKHLSRGSSFTNKNRDVLFRRRLYN